MLSYSRNIKAIIPLHVTISFPGESLTFSADAVDAFSKLQLQMIGAFTEFVRNIILKHQAEGIAKVKERGVYKNRKRKTVIDRDAVQKLKLSDFAGPLQVVHKALVETGAGRR